MNFVSRPTSCSNSIVSWKILDTKSGAGTNTTYKEGDSGNIGVPSEECRKNDKFVVIVGLRDDVAGTLRPRHVRVWPAAWLVLCTGSKAGKRRLHGYGGVCSKRKNIRRIE